MYETVPLGALGWSDIEGYPACNEQPGGGVKRCFLDTAGDILEAARQKGFKLNERCLTTGGNQGWAYCCPSGAAPKAGSYPILMCQRNVTPRSQMANEQQRVMWDIQSKLCEYPNELDSGPINGRLENPSFQPAIRAFQARRGIGMTGSVNEATLRALGFSSSQAVSMMHTLRAQAPTLIDDSAGGAAIFSASDLPWGLIAGSLAATTFAFWAISKYFSRR